MVFRGNKRTETFVLNLPSKLYGIGRGGAEGIPAEHDKIRFNVESFKFNVESCYISHAKGAEGADYLFINVMAQIHTEGLEIYHWLSLKLNKRACFLTNRTNQGHCPGAMHHKSLMRNICLKSCLKSVDSIIYQRDCTDYTELFLPHAKGAELYSLLLALALEGSQLHATESAEVTNGKRLRLKVVVEAIRVNRLWG